MNCNIITRKYKTIMFDKNMKVYLAFFLDVRWCFELEKVAVGVGRIKNLFARFALLVMGFGVRVEGMEKLFRYNEYRNKRK